ncbi:glycosyltransferase [Rhodopila sp.]|uniref:glycosyltransferase n=1 Tax=Rhodopila sp. TaxID=2480087 RepID=UPI003D12D6AB
MWPLDLPASAVLKLPGETDIAWAMFDWQWYLRSNPRAAADAGGADPATVLGYYLEQGQVLGHSPSAMFDEAWHRLRYPPIGARIVAGEWRSAFDAYCRRGALDRSPHWLFDEPGYRERYPDLTDDILTSLGICNGYDHYLRHGAQEDRIGHVLFDPAIYLAHFDPADVAAIRADGVFQHYLNRIESPEPELRTSIYFDPAWYLRRYPEVAREIQAKRWKCALHHYLCNDTPSAFDPLAGFSESWYLQRDPGLLGVVAAGNFRNGYAHFLRFGVGELRPPSATIDLAWYAAQPSVRADLEQGRATDAFAHWLTIGANGGLASSKPESERLTETQASHLFRQTAAAMLPIAGRFGYGFACSQSPAISVVMVVRDGFATTLATIASLHCNAPSDTELIIVDHGSADETRSIEQYVSGAQVIRFDDDLSWSGAADAGWQVARASAVLFLSAAATVAPGSIQRALSRLAADGSIGVVGGMILQPHGVIAEAGGIVWNNGATHGYQRGASPRDPEVNFVREVDFCGADFLLARTALLAQLDGFDHLCPTSHAAADLCLRIAQAGSRVVYDPSVMVMLGDAANSGAPNDHFQRKHATLLAERHPPGGPVQVFARHAGAKPHRVLFIEDTVPLRRIGSGFVRANDLVRVLASLGCAVTVFPVNGCGHDLAHVFGDMPDSVEVLHNSGLDRLAGLLRARAGYHDTIWLARTHNLACTRPILARLQAQGTLTARIVLDTEAITPQREAMAADRAGLPYDLPAAMRSILTDAEICRQTVAVTAAEADTLRGFGFPSVHVVGHTVEPNPTPLPFEQRSGMLFVGAIHNQDSPNFDSLVWLVEAVLPLVEAELKWETRLTIAGYTAPGIDLTHFGQHRRISLRGPLADLSSLYDSHRIFVAPTRYAAGAPFKVLEAASRGLPVVATELLRGQLDWRSGQEILAADADDARSFAACIVTLHRDPGLWRTIRDGALQRLRREYSEEQFSRSVAAVLRRDPQAQNLSGARTVPSDRP